MIVEPEIEELWKWKHVYALLMNHNLDSNTLEFGL